MELAATLRSALPGFSFAAGVNLYATVAVLGLAARYGWVSLPPQFQAFNNDVVIGVALVLYIVEFFADKIPYHRIRCGTSFIRPFDQSVVR